MAIKISAFESFEAAGFKSGSFLTPATEKTKTQAQNSRKKLNQREALSSF